jgi:hypothetical protein
LVVGRGTSDKGIVVEIYSAGDVGGSAIDNKFLGKNKVARDFSQAKQRSEKMGFFHGRVIGLRGAAVYRHIVAIMGDAQHQGPKMKTTN